LLDAGGDFEKARKRIQRNYYLREVPRHVDALNELQRAGAKYNSGGALYHVDLPDEKIARMLDYDAPLGSQSRSVKDALEMGDGRVQFLPGVGKTGAYRDDKNMVTFRPSREGSNDLRVTGSGALQRLLPLDKMMLSRDQAELAAVDWLTGGTRRTGVSAYNDLGGSLSELAWNSKDPALHAMRRNEQLLTSRHLQSRGVPGIRYLDGDSRMPRSDGRLGTSNFVVFPGAEDMLRILKTE
jgi:hypothetical protein